MDRAVVSHPHSLLAFLMREQAYAEAEFIWQHPAYSDFPRACQKLLSHARLFSETMHGAAVLYNLMLSELVDNERWVDKYRSAFGEWASSIDSAAIGRWKLDEFWFEVQHSAHQITWTTKQFVAKWIDLVAVGAPRLADDRLARSLIQQRERALKGNQSRFTNSSARARWGGASGSAPLSFRWSNVQTFLRDLRDAL